MRVTKYRVLAIFTWYFIVSTGYTQGISGRIQDRKAFPLEFASVALIKPQDSILSSFTSTSKQGDFVFENVKDGNYIIHVHLLGFTPYQKNIFIKGGQQDLGIITLYENTALDEVVVTLVTPISLKKDTVSYNARSFRVSEDATVEDLLKKLPGIEVDAAGKVSAQGEKVTRIYVDGKEFFSGDPAIAVKNLSASIISKVEVIDEKSEKERVTKIRDTERKKVINLELKEAVEVNGFGKAQGGYGTEDRYLSGINYNRFSSTVQLSVIGKLNNINDTGSGLSELTDQFKVSGMGTSDVPGFLTTGIAGVNTGFEPKDGLFAHADYVYNNNMTSTGKVSIDRTEYIDDAEIYSESRSQSESSGNNHHLNFHFRDRSKKMSSLYMYGSLNKNDQEATSEATLEKFNADAELDLQSMSNIRNNNSNTSGDMSLEYTTRFSEKSKRNISIHGRLEASSRDLKGKNYQVNRYLVSDPENTITESVQVERKQQFKRFNSNLSTVYTEPLANDQYLEFRADWNQDAETDQLDQAKLIDRVPENPLVYELDYTQTDLIGGLAYLLDKEKLTLKTGATFSHQEQSIDLKGVGERQNSYQNMLPFLSISYRPNREKSFRITASKSIQLPLMNQLNPVVNDFNPLFISKGNPELTPETNYSLSGMYVSHNLSSGFHLISGLHYRYKDNSIIRSEFTDSTGVRTSSFENLGDQNTFGLHASFSRTLKKPGLRLHMGIRGNYSEYQSLINGTPNETGTTNGSFDLSIENDKKAHIDWMLGGSLNSNYTVFTSGNNADRSYLRQSYYFVFDWTLTKRLNVLSRFNFDLYTDSNFGTDQSVPVWNASVTYALLKKRNLRIQLTGFDLLDQNRGIKRTSSDNFFEEMQQEILGNYFMLNLLYEFRKQ